MVINAGMILLGSYAIWLGFSRLKDAKRYNDPTKNKFGADDSEVKMEKVIANQDGFGMIVLGIIVLIGLAIKVFRC